MLTPDTGPLHMTVALDRPVVSLIGYSNPKRVGPYRKFRDLMIDAYGEPGEDYPLSMENRLDRMPRITVQTGARQGRAVARGVRPRAPGRGPAGRAP